MGEPQEGLSEAHRIAARVRAAVAYSGVRLEEISKRSELGTAKLRRIASATSPRGASPLELWAIADACGVPRAWLEIGRWDEAEHKPAPRPEQTYPFGFGDVEDRLEIIERYLFALLRLEETRGQPLPDLAKAARLPRSESQRQPPPAHSAA